MLEETDTRQPVFLTPEGTYQFTVKELPIKKPTAKGDKVYFVFKFAYPADDGKMKTHTEFLMPWQIKPFLMAFGFEADPGDKDKFLWDRLKCIGKTIQATIVHESDKKDPTKIRARMVEVTAPKTEEIPF